MVWSWGSDPVSVVDSGKRWRLRIPLLADGAHLGFIYLVRRLERERVLFQTASLLDTFSAHFPARLHAFPPAELTGYLESVVPSERSYV